LQEFRLDISSAVEYAYDDECLSVDMIEYEIAPNQNAAKARS
jgi:hypothetical protein